MTIPIGKLMIANRGEIAIRVAATAAANGVATATVFASDEVDAPHARVTDESLPLPGRGAAAYLDTEEVVAAAVKAGCDALHPGYGFLSESAAFARACAEAGILFIGPSPETLELFGDKARARRLARQLGVPAIAGTFEASSVAQAEAFFDSLGGAPMAIKAIAGGGGRGMRLVRDRSAVAEAFERCRSEAESAFGNGSLYVEAAIEGARHIEVQVAGEGTGRIAHIWDRDCSIQRQRQKIIEIAPAPGLSNETRRELFESSVRMARAASLSGLATVEFLVRGDEIHFLEVNPRLQVEHTVTEETTGLDLVEIQLRLATGSTLAELGLRANQMPTPRGIAIEARVNAEVMLDDGMVIPSSGTISGFQPPSGRGIRVDTYAHAGLSPSPSFDSLLAKVIVFDSSGQIERAASRLARALEAFEIRGIQTNVGLLRAILAEEVLGRAPTGFVDERAPILAATARALQQTTPWDAPLATSPGEASPTVADKQVATHSENILRELPIDLPPGAVPVVSAMRGVVVEVPVAEGDFLSAGESVAVIEAMKMQHPVGSPVGGTVHRIIAELGIQVVEGSVLAYVIEDAQADLGASQATTVDPDHIRADLAEVVSRHQATLDAGRPDTLERRHRTGRRSARENIDDLVDSGSFVEYGGLAIAAQRRRRSAEDLIANTPADGLVAGTATVGGMPCVVMSYDYTVLAGTQGLQNHRKKDRMFELALKRRLPVVIFAEGGGGRPGDTDTSSIAALDVSSFRLLAELSGKAPTIAVVSGYCFAGNAALAGTCDLIIATKEASLGMGGPAMIEGGGLGSVAPGDVGPMSVQVSNGVVDVLVDDDAAAVEAVRRYLAFFSAGSDVIATDQRTLRSLVPENRMRAYDVRPIIETLCDQGSILELRPAFGVGIITALARIGGRALGVMANNPLHLGGAIDAPAADKAARFVQLCNVHGLPVVSLVDTPGFMVGPESEKTATVRHFSRMFLAGAHAEVPMVAVVLRKAYGLGAMAMSGGSTKAPVLAVSWPTGEFGGMGLEGAVRLGYRRELDRITDPAERESRYLELVAQMYERGKALSIASVFEIDDVIDPAETRRIITLSLDAAHGGRPGGEAGYLDAW